MAFQLSYQLKTELHDDAVELLQGLTGVVRVAHNAKARNGFVLLDTQEHFAQAVEKVEASGLFKPPPPVKHPPMQAPVGTHGPPMQMPVGKHGPPMEMPVGKHGPPMPVPEGKHGPPMEMPAGKHGPPMPKPEEKHGAPMVKNKDVTADFFTGEVSETKSGPHHDGRGRGRGRGQGRGRGRGRPQRKTIEGHVLCINNVAHSTTNDQLFRTFEEFGEIFDIVRSERMAIVYMAQAQQVITAMSTWNGKTLNGALVTASNGGVVKVPAPQ